MSSFSSRNGKNGFYNPISLQNWENISFSYWKWKNDFKLSLIKNGRVVFNYVLKFSELSCLWSMTDYGAFIAKVFYCLAWWYFFSCRHCCQTSSQTVMLPSVLGCLSAGWHKVREPGNWVPRQRRISYIAKTPNIHCFVAKTRNYDFFVAKTRNYDIFVAKIYDYALIDSFWGFPRFIDSPTSYATLSSNRMRNNYTFKQFPMNIGYDSDFFLATTFSLLDGSEKIKPRKRKAEPFERIILYRTYYLCVRGLWIPFNWKMTSRREVVNKLKTDWRQTRPEEICLNSPAPQMATVWRTLSQGRDWPFLLNNPWPS